MSLTDYYRQSLLLNNNFPHIMCRYFYGVVVFNFLLSLYVFVNGNKETDGCFSRQLSLWIQWDIFPCVCLSDMYTQQLYAAMQIFISVALGWVTGQLSMEPHCGVYPSCFQCLDIWDIEYCIKIWWAYICPLLIPLGNELVAVYCSSICSADWINNMRNHWITAVGHLKVHSFSHEVLSSRERRLWVHRSLQLILNSHLGRFFSVLNIIF